MIYALIFPFLLVATVFADEVPISRQEADRFAQESRFLAQQGRYEAALEKAETAAALDPKNDEIKNLLVQSLFTQSSDILYPGEKFGHKALNRMVASKATADQVRKALDLADQGWDIVTTLPKNNFAVVYERERFLRLTWLREKLWILVERQFPELENDVRKFNRKTLEHWIEHRYRPRRATTTGSKSAGPVFDSLLVEAKNRTFLHQSPDDLALPSEMIVGEIIRLADESRTGPSNAAKDFLVLFAETAAKRKNIPEDDRDRSCDVVFERTIAALESNSSTTFRLFGWIARNNVVPRQDGTERDPRPAQQYFIKIRERLRALSENAPYADYSILYDELDRIVVPCLEPAYKVTVSSPIHPSDPYSLRFDILDLAESRNEIASLACESLIRQTTQDEKTAKALGGSSPRFAALVARARIRIAEHVAAAEKIDREIAEKLRRIAIAILPNFSSEIQK